MKNKNKKTGTTLSVKEKQQVMKNTAMEMHDIIKSFIVKKEILEYKSLPQFKRLGELTVGIKEYLKMEGLSWQDYFKNNFSKSEMRIIREAVSAFKVLDRYKKEFPKSMSITVAKKLGQMQGSASEKIQEISDKLINGKTVKFKGKKFSLKKKRPTVALRKLEKITKEYSGRKTKDAQKPTFTSLGALASIDEYLSDYKTEKLNELTVLKKEYRRMKKGRKLAFKIRKKFKALEQTLSDKIADIKHPEYGIPYEEEYSRR